MDDPVFAAPADYEARYGEADPARLAALLEDASGILLAEFERHEGMPYMPGANAAFDRAAKAACCKLANQALGAPDGFAGATQYSQGAGGYTASVTYGSALGSMFLGKSDLKALGLSGSALRSLRPMRGGERGCAT